MSLLDRLERRLPYRLSTWISHARNFAKHRRQRREVVSAEEVIRRTLEPEDEEIEGGFAAERAESPGPFYRYTLKDFDRHRCIFVHVPKAAGISVASGLFGHLAGGHRTVREYRRIFGWDFDRYFVFTIVRNPFARLASAYDYLMGDHPVFRFNARYRDTVLSRYGSFAEFVLEGLETAVEEHVHFRPQTHFVCANGSLDVDFVGSVETLEEDFRYICDRLGLEASLPHRNQSDGPERPLGSYYSVREVADTVRSVYARDFELLDYDPEVPARAV